MLARLGEHRPESVTVRAVHGFPVEEIINAGMDADIIVLGSRGTGGFTRLMLGSVAGQVVQHAHCRFSSSRARTTADLHKALCRLPAARTVAG